MQKTFHGKFKSLNWHVNGARELKKDTVVVDYDFTGTKNDGDIVESSGLEYLKIKNGRIISVEIQNKG